MANALSSRKHKVAKEAMISDAAETLGNLKAKHANSLVVLEILNKKLSSFANGRQK